MDGVVLDGPEESTVLCWFVMVFFVVDSANHDVDAGNLRMAGSEDDNELPRHRRNNGRSRKDDDMDVGDDDDADDGGGKPSPKKKPAPMGPPGLCAAALSMATEQCQVSP